MYTQNICHRTLKNYGRILQNFIQTLYLNFIAVYYSHTETMLTKWLFTLCGYLEFILWDKISPDKFILFHRYSKINFEQLPQTRVASWIEITYYG